jgi:hypothetical protein
MTAKNGKIFTTPAKLKPSDWKKDFPRPTLFFSTIINLKELPLRWLVVCTIALSGKMFTLKIDEKTSPVCDSRNSNGATSQGVEFKGG